MKILITGGLGFIGINLIKDIIKNKKIKIFNVDKISYCSMPEALDNIKINKNYNFKKIDIYDYSKFKRYFFKIKPDQVINLAAESHVDNSIKNPDIFIKSNIIGTYNLLKICNEYLTITKKKNFKLLHVSTDEVFGSLNEKSIAFTENSNFNPNSPYSSSKASSDLLVKAWHKTFKIPILITNCSNNFGPWQFPEKLIPVIINQCINKKPIPIYGNGTNIRDWIFVKDHIRALKLVLSKGKIGQTYNIGTNNEKNNLKLANLICEYFNKKYKKDKFNYQTLISFVDDRKGHDYRYAINNKKIKNQLGFKYKKNFMKNLEITINWYIDNREWLRKKRKTK